MNCLGETPQLRLEKAINEDKSNNNYKDHDAHEDGVKEMIDDYIKEICENPDAKGTLVHAVKNGH